MNRNALHNLIERLPEEELAAAKRFVEYPVVNPMYRAALSAPEDDERVSDADAAAIARSQGEMRSGSVTTHDEILREFGMVQDSVGLFRHFGLHRPTH